MADSKLTTDEVFAVADEMLAAAAAAQEKRRGMKNISDADFDAFVEKETALRYDADRFRAVGITLLANDGILNARKLVTAIHDGEQALKNIARAKTALSLLARLVELGTSIAGGNVQMILASLASLKKVTDEL